MLSLASITLFVMILVVGAHGRPLGPIRRASTTAGSGSSNNTAIIAAGVSGGVAAIALAYFVYRRRRRSRTPTTVNRAPGPSEAILATAQANLNATTGTTAPANASNTRRERRARRTRRTPSQISTKSLPAYKEEPGDQELVLVRRAMDPQMEESEDMDQSTTDVSNMSRDYSPYPPSSTQVNESLLHTDGEDDSGDMDAVSPHRPNRATGMSVDSVMYGSADSHGTMGSGTGLLSSATEAISGDATDEPTQTDVMEEEDIRGEAPPYFEYQGPLADPEPTPDPSHDNTTSNESTPGPETTSTRNRLSMSMPRPLRVLFSGSLRNRPSNAPATPSPLTPPPQSPSTRQRSDTMSTVTDRSSSRSLLLSRSRSPSHVRLGSLGTALSRPLTNNSSHSSLSHQRTRSGSSSGLYNAAAGAESSLSVNSTFISSPLAHTVTRTAISFPKAGPTPEQIKFLSSRESLGRFGVPFGVDAEAAAREARTKPPPAFPGEGDAASPSNSNPPMIRAVTAPWWETLTSPAAGSTSVPTSPRQELSELSPLSESIEDEAQSPTSPAPRASTVVVADTLSTTSPASTSHTQKEPSGKVALSNLADPPAPPVSRQTTRSSSLSVTITIPGGDNDLEGISPSGLAVNLIPASPLTPVERH